IPFNKQNIKKFVNYKPSEETKSKSEETMDEAVMEFLSDTDAQTVKLDNGNIVIEGKYSSVASKFVTLSDMKLLCHILDLNHKPINESAEYQTKVKSLSNILGANVIVESAGKFIIVSSSSNPSRVLLLK